MEAVLWYAVVIAAAVLLDSWKPTTVLGARVLTALWSIGFALIFLIIVFHP
jgi:hypothetical protein